MKILIILFAIIIVASAGWYFGSPLFIDREINESFPELDTLPTEEEIMKQMEGMTESEKIRFQEEIMKRAENMPDTVMEEESPVEASEPADGETAPKLPLLLTRGTFVGADNFHKGSGTVSVYELETGKRFLRFENFSVTNGPDLRVYLTSHPNPTSEADVKSDAYLEVAKLKGNKGNQNYELPSNIDIDDYNTVLIYCKPFHVSFATASLN